MRFFRFSEDIVYRIELEHLANSRYLSADSNSMERFRRQWIIKEMLYQRVSLIDTVQASRITNVSAKYLPGLGKSVDR
jgi:hypothetical protein